MPEEQDEIFQLFCFKYQLGKYDLEKVADGIKEFSLGVTRLGMRKVYCLDEMRRRERELRMRPVRNVK